MIWLKRLCALVGAVLLVALLATGLWLGTKIALYDQQENEAHLAQKKSYLKSIEQLDQTAKRPNVVLILFDDLGYGDFGITGSTAIKTPAIDELAQNGISLSNFYSPAPVCTPSRAGFLTGRFPVRAGIPQVVFPSADVRSYIGKLSGLNSRFPADEITLADTLKAAGYATGMVGKWHLGDQAPSLPNDMGFESFFGSLYSNDMEPFALYRNREIEVEAPADQTRLNEWYGNEVDSFITTHKSEPFFLYFAHNFPHIPLFTPDKDKNRSAGGLYGDVVESLDDVVARAIGTLKANGVYENTIVLISSDNGPWYQGSAGNNRGRKAETFEGGMHVPMIVHWPEKFKQGKTVDNVSMGIDWYPTLMEWLSIPLPTDRIIDGQSLAAILEDNNSQEKQTSESRYLYYFNVKKLKAVRNQRYKYFDDIGVHYSGGMSFAVAVPQGAWLFDMKTDSSESYDISSNNPKVTKSMRDVFEQKRIEIRDNERGWLE